MTLVELLIAVALLGFIALAIAPLFLSSVKSNYAANEYTSIHILARDRLEQLMNKPFNDAALSVGVHANDQAPMLPDPATGVPPASGGVVNPFTITYQVLQYQIAGLDTASTPANAAFAPTRITAAGQPFDYKRVDVTVRTSSVSGILGLNSHVARVSGIVGNPSPQGNLSTVDARIGGGVPVSRRPFRSEAGFTLVEMIVVVFLLAIAMLGILAVFDASARINKSEQDVADAQGSVRFGIYKMTRAIRMAGSGGLYVTQAILNAPDPQLLGVTVGSGTGYDNVTGASVQDYNTGVAIPVRDGTDMIEVRGVIDSPLLAFNPGTQCPSCSGSERSTRTPRAPPVHTRCT